MAINIVVDVSNTKFWHGCVKYKILTDKARTSPTHHYQGPDMINFFTFIMQKFKNKQCNSTAVAQKHEKQRKISNPLRKVFSSPSILAWTKCESIKLLGYQVTNMTHYRYTWHALHTEHTSYTWKQMGISCIMEKLCPLSVAFSQTWNHCKWKW